MRTKAIQIMSELADAYTAIPPTHKEYIESHMDEIAEAALIASLDMGLVLRLHGAAEQKIAALTPEEIQLRNKLLRDAARNMKV